MSQILLITHWTGGDVLPFIRLGRKLKADGHQAVVFSHCRYEEIAQEAGLEFVSVDRWEQYEAMNHELYQLADPIKHREEYVSFHRTYHGAERLLAEVQLLAPYCKRKDTIIIARHRSSISGLLAAEMYHLPYASMILAPNYFAHMQLHDELMGAEFVKDINEAREQLGLRPITGWLDWLYSPKVIFGMWPEWFAGRDESWPKGAKAVGFLEERYESNWYPWEPELLDYLSDQKQKGKALALITGGSSRMIDPLFYATAVDACRLAGISAILVTPYEEYWPKEQSENLMVCRAAPLKEIMKQVDLIIHHGGMGTISEALNAALPQIILPHLTDGPDNAERLARVKIAKKFPVSQWHAGRIAEVLVETLNDGTKERCLRYAKINDQESKNQQWKRLLAEIPVYEYQEGHVLMESKNQAESKNNQPSREQLLALLRRRKGQMIE